MLSLWQLRSKVGQVFKPTGTRWRNNHTEAVTCGFSRTFTLPISSSSLSLTSLHLLPPRHPASISFHCVPGVTKLCGDTLQLLRCLLNYGRSLEATALMKHAARSHISLWRGETCCWGVNYSDSKYHSSRHAKTSDKKPPATPGLHTSLVGYTNQPTTYNWEKAPAAQRKSSTPCLGVFSVVWYGG